MRVFLISLVLAIVLQLPNIAEHLDKQWPGMGIIGIPFTGLDYMAVFFHELGHTVARWLFGYPAIPTFDWENGGGMTYAQERSNIVLGLDYAALAGGAFVLWKCDEYVLLAGLGVLIVAHLAIAFNQWNEIFCVYMGHGGELLVASFCMVRAALKKTDREKGPVELYLNMVFGIFVFIRDGIMVHDLMTDQARRDVYSMAKGGHTTMDLDKIAEMLHTNVQHVAAFCAVFMFLCLIGVLYFVVTGEQEDLPDLG